MKTFRRVFARQRRQLRMIHAVASHERHLPLKLSLCPEEPGRVRIIAREEDHVRGCRLNLFQKFRVIGLARRQGSAIDRGNHPGIKLMRDGLGQTFSVKALIVQHSDLFKVQLPEHPDKRFGLFIVPGAGSKEIGESFFRERHGRGAVRNLENPGFVKNALNGLCSVRCVRADDGDHPLLNQLLRG